MLNLSELLVSYPEVLRVHRSFILREYLQCKILEILFDGPYASRFCFLGGTCLRLVHNNTRFSEDLDFDNFQVTEAEFTEVSTSIRIGLELQGFQVEMKQIIRGAYHCYIKFPGLLFQQGISGYREEKILIQLDTEPQHFSFKPESYILNRFDVTTQVLTTPLDILLAQKFTALCQRKKNKGRDFFDIVFLLSKSVKPNYAFLEMKLGVTNREQLLEQVKVVCQLLDMEEMVKDVRNFLFYPADEKKVRLFLPVLEQSDF
ncbi:MAG TPA: nucleotidyl transferase AbiEii/AbiGii toxin family protein [Saprospiraceae bacterium]|nr:nucleotidyl transferase AbiEii/AbiGii toxin family protein [Saprospiraceae bacterium]